MQSCWLDKRFPGSHIASKLDAARDGPCAHDIVMLDLPNVVAKRGGGPAAWLQRDTRFGYAGLKGVFNKAYNQCQTLPGPSLSAVGPRA